jgi:branched-chain amino acid transport system permease protein
VWTLVEALLSGIASGSIYALVALGFSFIFASTRVVNFAQGDWAMMAGMVGATVAAGPLGVVGAAIAAPISGALIGAVVAGVFVRWSRSRDAISVSLILLGMSFVLQGCALAFWGVDPLGIPALAAQSPIYLGRALIPRITVLIIFVALVLLGAISAFLQWTSLGRAMVATADNPEAAALVGIDVRRLIIVSYLLSGVLAGIAGFLITPVTGMTYLSGLPLTLKAFAAAALGGLRTPAAAVVGGLSLGCIEALAATYFGGQALGQLTGVLGALIALLFIAPWVMRAMSARYADVVSLDLADDSAPL